eukprot:Protomagalhaensia_wolfi_Nauph_80__5855@NODE_747_length_2034_cov_204_971930_g560_i0_p1_GENE_NODE_747_length_2034_cov_204_971930_g560_i0NODE_747_length_2034_cov_204_971930_g560_i0_p1_ORF_typecomplete_len246_score31_94HXXEE/PF13787_6/1_6e03HXXEE/PF13787_6/1_5e05HXXEE/PF13787_6/1_4e03FTR1/PF03239_14/3_9e02FTR1/PF03239_14/1_1_NODE_747_length_2034_cov_204_971930_g560_i062799
MVFRRYWYDFGGAVAVTAACVLYWYWDRVPLYLFRLTAINFIVFLCLQFEGFQWPGGMPGVVNVATYKSNFPERYPLNQNSAMVSGCLYSFLLYLPPVFWPNLIWLGLAPVAHGLILALVHTFSYNMEMGTWYNPGMICALFGHGTVGTLYVWHVHTNGLASWKLWTGSLCYLAIFVLLARSWITYSLLKDLHSPYPFAPEELDRFYTAYECGRLGKSRKYLRVGTVDSAPLLRESPAVAAARRV